MLRGLSSVSRINVNTTSRLDQCPTLFSTDSLTHRHACSTKYHTTVQPQPTAPMHYSDVCSTVSTCQHLCPTGINILTPASVFNVLLPVMSPIILSLCLIQLLCKSGISFCAEHIVKGQTSGYTCAGARSAIANSAETESNAVGDTMPRWKGRLAQISSAIFRNVPFTSPRRESDTNIKDVGSEIERLHVKALHSSALTTLRAARYRFHCNAYLRPLYT